MRILLDTCVLSEIQRKEGSAAVRDAVEAIPDENLFISVITIGEIAKGIALLDESRRKRTLKEWLDFIERDYAHRILPFDQECARLWGELTASAKASGFTVGATDGQIAATAIRHGLHVMTRNVKDFEPTGAMLLNPWT